MKSILYTGGIGLNNKITSHRLPFDRETGVTALEGATDVVIDRTGEVMSRKGTFSSVAGSFHSLYKINDESFYVVQERTSDSALFFGVIDSSDNITLTGVRSGMVKGTKFSYFKLDEIVHYSNGVNRGCLTVGESSPWPTNQWTGPESNINFGITPIGDHIELFNGRGIVTVDDELFYTEYGLLGIVDLTRARRRFESRITMVKSVQTGLYVSDEHAVYFLFGKDPKAWTIQQVTSYPAVEWAVEQELVDPSYFGFETNQLSCLFGTVQGPVVGLPDGSVYNLINKNVTMPQSCGLTSGSLMVVDETMIIQSGEL